MARVILSEASVRVSVDVRGGEREAERAGEQAGRDYAKGAQRGTKKNPAKIQLDPITADFERQVRTAVGKIANSLNADIPLTIKGERLRAQAAVAIGEIERTLAAKIPTDPAGALDYRRKLALLVREASRGVRANVDLDVDKDGVRRAGSTFANLATTGVGAFAKLGATIKGVTSEAVSGISSMSGPLLSVLKAIFAIQYVVPGMAAGITLAGGAGVAAFGAISAAAIGLPVVLTSIGAPIAAIMLGMDGIKLAAGVLSDEFKHLKDVVNVAFELGMRPVFERLQALFPTISVGMGEVSRAVVRIASDLTAVVTSEAGIENLRVAFGGVSDMVDKSREGVANLFSALLNVAGTAPLYDILGETIGGVAARFGNMIERVRSSGDLERALASLRDVLFGVTDMLNVLIEGSIKFFAAAGPGLTSFFASLTDVLSRIDWASLGESFGGMMERLGTAIQNIPPEKWQELADAVGGLSEKFIKMVEEGTFIDFIEAITGIANALFMLKSALDGIEDGLNGLSDMLDGAGMSIYDNVTQPFYHAVADLFGFLGIGSPAQKFIDIALAIIEGFIVGMAGGPAAVFTKVRELAQSALNALSDAGTFLVDKGRQLAEGVRNGIGDKLEDVKNKAGEIKGKVRGALSDAKSWLVQTGQDLADGFISGIGSKIEAAASKAGELARRAWEAARNFIEPGSPSRLFRRLGLTIGPGLAAGISDSAAMVLAAISKMLGSVSRLLPAGLSESISKATQAAVQNNRAGMIQAEDGSFVSPSFYSSRPGGPADLATILAEAGARADERRARELADAVAVGINGARLAFEGPSVVQVVNDGNRQLARR